MDAKPECHTDEVRNTEISSVLPIPRMANSSADLDELPNVAIIGPTAFEVFIAWEKLRLIFNIVLIVVVVGMCNPILAILISPMLIEDALIANACFCAGIVAESCLTFTGMPRRLARILLFVVGTATASAGAFHRVQWILDHLRD